MVMKERNLEVLMDYCWGDASSKDRRMVSSVEDKASNPSNLRKVNNSRGEALPDGNFLEIDDMSILPLM